METNKPTRIVPITIALIAVIFIIGIALYLYSVNHTMLAVDTTPIATSTNTSTNSTTTNPSNENPTQVTATVNQVNTYYIALEDGGKSGKAVGCGDSVVPVKTNITPTQAPLKAALEALFSYKKEYYGESGFRNALSASNLKIDSATVSNGIATVKISGTVSLGGVCDDPRFISQIKETVMQFPSITSANITINNKTLESYGSEK